MPEYRAVIESAQVDFAEVRPLRGFPGSGLLQWFVAGTGNYGLTYDETAATVGFEARRYGGHDLTTPAQLAPGDTLSSTPRDPGPAGHGGWGRAVAFTLEDGVPSREELDSLEDPGYRLLREADPDWETYDSDDNPQPYGRGPRSAATRTPSSDPGAPGADTPGSIVDSTPRRRGSCGRDHDRSDRRRTGAGVL